MLGAAAGGGFPQWNSAAPGCRRARAGDPAARPATQCSLAVSADDRHWVLLDASPDLRTQFERSEFLHPIVAPRSTPLAAVVLTGADVDHIAGLLTLREGQPFTLHATTRVHDVLSENPVFDVLRPDVVRREHVALGEPITVTGPEGTDTGIRIRMFDVPGKVALYMEDPDDESGRLGTAAGDVVGLEVSDGATTFFYIPGCARMTPDLARRLHGAELVFFDSTLWRDDELLVAGVGRKTGARMGHMSVSGPDGVMSAFVDLDVRRKVCIHLNNTNPLLLADSPERAEAEAAGWTIAHDGMELTL